jgi:hypothetical protein
MKRPLAVELFCGTFGWSQGWLALGGRAIGVDLEHLPHHGPVPPGADLILQDCLTLDGAQFKDADILLCSPPCTRYSWLAMPWSRSTCPVCGGSGFVPGWGDRQRCDCKEQSRQAKELRAKWMKEGPDNRLFDDCFRIQREAIAAAGRYIPMVIENVRGAVPWVGKRDMALDQWNSIPQQERIALGRPDGVFGSFYLFGDVAQIGNRVVAGRELVDIRAGRGRFGMGVEPEKAVKLGGGLTNQAESDAVRGDGRKQGGAQSDWFSKAACDAGSKSRFSSKSNARKAASALIARIPPALSAYVAAQHFPKDSQ